MKKSFLYVLILFILPTSCKKAIEVLPTSILTSSTFWKTESDAIGALNGMYVNLRSDAAINLFILGEARAQTMSQALAGTVGLDIYYLNSLNVDNISVSWGGFYKTIDAANLLLKYVPEINITTAGSKNNILAQAYTMRAFCYFVLAKAWGGVPIRTEPTEGYDPLTIQKERASVDDVFKLIKADLNQAILLFPNNNFATGRNTWTKAGANTLKADVFLWTAKLMNGGNADLQTALTALNDVQSADVGLLPVFADIFNYNNKGNREVIMSSRFQVNESANNYYEYMYVNASNNPSNVSQATKDYVGVIGSGNAGNSIMQVAAPVRALFTVDDTRKGAAFYEIRSTTNAYIASIAGTKGNGTVVSGIRHFKNDVMIYRYADVLLMKAEAKNALGQDPSPEINLVRTRAYGAANMGIRTYVNDTKDTNDAAILQERLLELVTEGKRWDDVRRFDKVNNLVPSMAGAPAFKLLFPIGTSVISLEPKVTENSGWKL